MVRKEKYELPPEAIREMIINAHCNRNLLDESCIQVAVYDDRLEVTSPGGLYNGLTYEEVMNGHSKIRNKGIANIFSQMGLVEAWGSGIKRILNAAEEYGLPKPRFQEFRDEFEADIKKSRVSPRESLLFTYSFLKKENGCLLKIISETSGIIHVSKDICERIRSYIKRMKLGKRGEELQALVDSGGDLFIDFDGDAAYANKEAVFFKPAGAWIHFAIDYLRALNTENYEDLFYATIKEKDVDELEKGRFWIFVYEMEFDGFFDAKSYEYIICQEDEVVESWKRFFNRGTNWKDFPQVTSYEEYRRITDKQHLSKAKSMPIKFLKASGKGFFIDKDGYALGIRDELADVIKVDAFKKQMKDIIEYRTMEYYRRRYVET